MTALTYTLSNGDGLTLTGDPDPWDDGDAYDFTISAPGGGVLASGKAAPAELFSGSQLYSVQTFNGLFAVTERSEERR